MQTFATLLAWMTNSLFASPLCQHYNAANNEKIKSKVEGNDTNLSF